MNMMRKTKKCMRRKRGRKRVRDRHKSRWNTQHSNTVIKKNRRKAEKGGEEEKERQGRERVKTGIRRKRNMGERKEGTDTKERR